MIKPSNIVGIKNKLTNRLLYCVLSCIVGLKMIH